MDVLLELNYTVNIVTNIADHEWGWIYNWSGESIARIYNQSWD